MLGGKERHLKIRSGDWDCDHCNCHTALSETSGKERQILYVFTDLWNLKHKTNKYNKTETDSNTENKLVVSRKEGVEEGVK